MTFPTIDVRPTTARITLGYVLFAQAVFAVVIAGLGALYASTYFFETNHSGDFDGIQVPIGLFIVVAGIAAAVVLLVALSHLLRDGKLAAVCFVELVAFSYMAQVTHNPIVSVLRLSIWVALACAAVDAGSRLLSAHRRDR